MRRMGTGGLLEIGLIHELHEATLKARLDRKTLLGSLPVQITAGFPKAPSRRDQVFRDLSELNALGELEDKTIPLRTWLETAKHLAGPRREVAVFQKALDALPPAASGARAPSRKPSASRTAARAGAAKPRKPRPTATPPPPSSPNEGDPPPDTPPPDSRQLRHLAKLEADLVGQLKRAPAATTALAKHLRIAHLKEDLETAVTRALLHEKTGKQAVIALDAADEDLREDATHLAERRLLKKILLQTLPFTVDWRPYVQHGRAALASGRAQFVDLQLGTDTMREAILAGIDLRPCNYHQDQREGPAGKALIRLPAANQVFIHRLGEATVGLLAIQLFGYAPDAPELKHYASLRKRVNEALQFYSETRGDEYLPRWLLLEEEHLAHADTPLPTGPDLHVTMAVGVLSAELPFLRILRRGKHLDGETNLALHVGAFWRKPLGFE